MSEHAQSIPTIGASSLSTSVCKAERTLADEHSQCSSVRCKGEDCVGGIKIVCLSVSDCERVSQSSVHPLESVGVSQCE